MKYRVDISLREGVKDIASEAILKTANGNVDLGNNKLQSLSMGKWFIIECDDDFESEFLKSQKEYDPEGWETLYVDKIVRKGKSSNDWYMKRGYIVGGWQKGSEYEHLIGKFVGNVDNLSTGKCVLKIEGDTRTSLV